MKNEATAFTLQYYLIIKIGVREWKIIFLAILGLKRRAKTFLL